MAEVRHYGQPGGVELPGWGRRAPAGYAVGLLYQRDREAESLGGRTGGL
jgi:hypothetical protein